MRLKHAELFHRSRTGAVKVWSIRLNSDATVTRTWGIQGGQLQTTTEKATTRGKAGTKAFKDEKTVAAETYQRYLDTKLEQGFVDDPDTVRADVQIGDDFDFLAIPTSFQAGKPKQSITREEVLEWQAQDLIYVQRKRDGQRVWALVTPDGTIRLYTRSHEDITANLPLLVKALVDLKLPVMTILDGELVVDADSVSSDNFRALRGLTGSKPEKARMNEREYHPRYMVFDVLFASGEATHAMPYEQRYALVQMLLGDSADRRGETIGPVHIAENLGSLENGEALVKKFKWEGLVIWRKDEATRVHLNGKEWRGNAYKYKLFKTGDFIATGYYTGKGKTAGVVAGINLAEYVDGKLTPMCDCGSGFDAATREEALTWKYPVTVEVKYEKQEPDSGALRFPIFLRKRADKPIKECVRGHND